MCSRNKCVYKVSLDGRGESVVVKLQEHDSLADIQELVSWSKKEQVCPYYLARKMSKTADLLLIPYNYLLDPKLRKRHKIDIKNRILIIDEAHNVEQVCEDAYSMTLKSTDIEGAIVECDEKLAKGKQQNEPLENTKTEDYTEQIEHLKNSLFQLRTEIQ